MQTNEFKTIIIKADNNKYLTQSDNKIILKDRIVCRQVALGKNDKVENWTEITEEEGDEIKLQQEELRQQEAEENNDII